ncbi:PREDICTED: olfactory receptor 6M1-like [Gekko japonicus]|uniref:Olfactory receptor n=1 Tax=Gekko japonicus TaxID=146911 RepID=A0ABM1JPN7_GEKJA|nr:PREDICTED: olfactory receptor 6M1-like [Gekko japonicus]
MKNQTRSVSEIILLGFPVAKRFEPLLFTSFLITYTIALAGNFLIITVVWCEHSLHSPMYMFIANLSLLEALYTTSVIPKMLADFFRQKKSITFNSCIFQAYLYFSAGSTEFFLLGVMSFDRYVAICNPLRYTAIMNTRFCMHLIAASWLSGFLAVMPPAILILQLPFCGPNIINHFFCDVGPLLKLSCFDTKNIERMNFSNAAFFLLGSLLVTGVSYMSIIVTVIKIPSAKGRQKAFSTCASHLMVVTLFYGSSIFIYVQPQENHSLDLNKVASILNTVVTPLLNPFIYSLRNKKVKEALESVVRRIIGTLTGMRVLNIKKI